MHSLSEHLKENYIFSLSAVQSDGFQHFTNWLQL